MADIHQSWRDTAAIFWKRLGLNRTDVEAGWPESFDVAHIAMLQRPYQFNSKDAKGMALCAAYLDGLRTACSAKKIERSISKKTIQPRSVDSLENERNGFAGRRFHASLAA